MHSDWHLQHLSLGPVATHVSNILFESTSVSDKVYGTKDRIGQWRTHQLSILHGEAGGEARSLLLGQGFILLSIRDDMGAQNFGSDLPKVIIVFDPSSFEIFLHSDLTDCQTQAVSSCAVVTTDPFVKDDLRKTDLVKKSSCPLLNRNEMLFGERLPNQTNTPSSLPGYATRPFVTAWRHSKVNPRLSKEPSTRGGNPPYEPHPLEEDAFACLTLLARINSAGISGRPRLAPCNQAQQTFMARRLFVRLTRRFLRWVLGRLLNSFSGVHSTSGGQPVGSSGISWRNQRAIGQQTKYFSTGTSWSVSRRTRTRRCSRRSAGPRSVDKCSSASNTTS